MCGQSADTSDGNFSTRVTRERPLARVDSEVTHQLPFLGEILSADLADERFLSTVRSHVMLQADFHFEAFLTHCTCERHLTCVDSHVNKHVALSDTFPADGATGAVLFLTPVTGR